MEAKERSAPTWIDHTLRLFAVIIGGAIVGFSVATPPKEATWLGRDELLHLVAYLAFNFVMLLALVARPGRRSAPRSSGRLLTALVVAGGTGMETVQAVVGRDPSPLDALANATGAVVALGLWSLVLRRSERKASRREGSPRDLRDSSR